MTEDFLPHHQSGCQELGPGVIGHDGLDFSLWIWILTLVVRHFVRI